MENSEKIAVIGMACRYPGANNVQEYWNNLINGKETIKHFSDKELSQYEVNYEELKNNPGFVPARGILDDIDKFDAGFFGYTPKHAELIDPQHRIWLETTWHALENAGCNPYTYPGAIGVYAGGYVNTYLLNNVLRDKRKYENFIRLRTTESFQIMTSNDISYLPTKTAYQFNLTGPAINIQTACSTSLVAIAQACNSLFNYESDICLAGGVCILTPQETGYIHQQGAIPSPDGHCRPFDARGEGTVFSNGVGAVVLKRYEDAIKDKDNIVAVVSGWALNNDGNKKVSYTAPSVEGQTKVIRAAQSLAGINANQVSYIEAHGTATSLGDPIEITALSKAFAETTDKKQFCGIGSVKSNIGHTDAAAGVASFIKLCLIAQHKQIPPTLHYQTPNPHIKFENTPFYVVDKPTDINPENQLVMGVSSFGIGGTNAHIVVEAPPVLKQDTAHDNKTGTYFLPVSAKSKKALHENKLQLSQYLTQHPQANIDNIAYTLWHGRNHFPYRATCIINKNIKTEEHIFIENKLDENATALAFAFPGQGSQYVGMGKALYNEDEAFKKIVDHGCELYKSITQTDLKDLLFNNSSTTDAEIKLAETAITQPALFITQYAMAKRLIDKGLSPSYVTGHSIGEYAAACIAGVFDFQTALKIVIKRGELMQKMPSGTMYAVKAPREKLLEISNGLFELAANNAPDSCTISFDTSHTEQINKILEDNNINFIPLNTSHAFHSKFFDPILKAFSDFVGQFKLHAPTIPTISCLSGYFLTEQQATNPNYWSQQLRNPVMFYKGIKTILEEEDVVFIETGANSHLTSILKAIPEFENKKASILTLGRPDNPVKQNILEYILAQTWCTYKPYTPDLNFIASNAVKTVLPGYAFEKQRHWIDYKWADTPAENNQVSKPGNASKSSQTAKENESTIDKVTNIWEELLGIENIKPTDNFFYIGGTSLMAISVVDKCKEIFKCNLVLKSFFDAPTTSEFSTYIDTIQPATTVSYIEKNNEPGKYISGEI